MPNTFGAPGAGLPLVDPRQVRHFRQRFRRQEITEVSRANSVYVPGGRWPASGWLLMTRNSYNQINPYATNLQLQLADLDGNSVTLNSLTVVQARCVTRGVAADPNALYLVQITDGQGVIYNPWFQLGTTSQYNIQAPAYDGQFYQATTNGGTPWTWDGMVGDLWNQASQFLGPYPHLPTTPAGTPTGFSFPGVPLWEAINLVLDYLGMTVAENLSLTAPYTIVTAGAPDAAFSALQAQLSATPNVLEDDEEWLDTGSGRAPAQVVVYFHRQNQYYGTEETVRFDQPQWQSVPLYQVTVAGPTIYAKAGGTAYLWSDTTIRFDVNGQVLPADATLANAVALERATQYYAKITRSTTGYMRQVYTGIRPFVTGSQVDGVRWFMAPDYTGPDARGAWRTEIIRGFMWDDVLFPTTLRGLTGPG